MKCYAKQETGSFAEALMRKRVHIRDAAHPGHDYVILAKAVAMGPFYG